MDLKQYQWKNRLLRVFALSPEDQQYQEQLELLSNDDELTERDLVMVHMFSMGSGFAAEDDQGFLQWVALSTTDVIREMRVARDHMMRRLETLSEEEFARVGVHPLYGELTLTQWLEFFLIHQGHHLYLALLRARSAT